MDHPAEFAVTLSPALYAHLADEARRLNLPLEWLAASLVVDTLESPVVAPAESTAVMDAA
jgi:hypothetical protein